MLPSWCARVFGAVLVLLCVVVLAASGGAQPVDDEDEDPDDAAVIEEEDEDEIRERNEEETDPRGEREGGREARALVGRLEVVLRVPLGGAASTQAALLDRTAIVPLRDGRITSVDVDTGRIGWTVEAAATHPPAAGDGLAFVATADALIALDLAGAVRWSLPVAGGFSAPPLWDTGWLIAATSDGEVLCLRARDGQVLWTRSLGSPASARPAIAADRVYLSLDDGRVTALDLLAGTIAWERRLGGKGASPLALDDRLFVGSADRFFYCLSTEDGDRRWRYRAGGAVVSPAVVDFQHVYFTGLNNVLRAHDRFNGSQKWIEGLSLRPMGGPLLIGDLVLVAGAGAEARAYRTSDGELAAEHNGASDLAAAPQLIPHAVPEFATVLLLTRDGEVQLLRRSLDVPILPLTQPIGVPVPLVPPPGFTG